MIAVRGESSREVEPEIAEFSVVVLVHDRDRASALVQLSTRVAEVRAVLDGFDAAIEKRETSRLSVYSRTKTRSEKVAGYTGSATTTVRVVDLDRVGEMMLRVGDLDQVDVHGPWWSLRPTSSVYRDARQAAITDAVRRAREYADALGSRVTGLIELSDIGMSGGNHFAMRSMAKTASLSEAGYGSPELNLDPQAQLVSAQIEARFTITEPLVLADPVD